MKELKAELQQLRDSEAHAKQVLRHTHALNMYTRTLNTHVHKHAYM